MPRVSFILPELAKMLPRYRLIRDCLSGSEAVKASRDLYLPIPNATDTSPENLARYNGYIKRAVFYNATARTLAGLIGMVFARPPISEIPDTLDAVENDATGTGVTLEQMAKGTLAYTFSYGRSGLLIDFPNTGGSITVAQRDSGEIRPTITNYSPMSIINWRTVTEGAITKLSMVNIAEEYGYADDGFEVKTACQFRVLKLVNGVYTIQTWKEEQPNNWTADKKIPNNDNFRLMETVTPTGPDGKPFDQIPFMFVGIHNNDHTIDLPPLYDLADLNIAHYRNSADYEEACYMLGQPTFWLSGLSESWVKEIMGGAVRLGSSGGILLPVGGAAGLLQPEPNTMVKEAMEAKERQMVSLGAKLVEQKTVQRTATEAGQDKTSENSVLSTGALNVTAAYKWALEWCAEFLNIPSDKISYTLNSDFNMMALSSLDRAQLTKEWQAGQITFEEMRAVLRKAGYATEDDKVAQGMIAEEQAAAMALVVDAMPADPVSGAPSPAAKPVPPKKPVTAKAGK